MKYLIPMTLLLNLGVATQVFSMEADSAPQPLPQIQAEAMDAPGASQGGLPEATTVEPNMVGSAAPTVSNMLESQAMGEQVHPQIFPALENDDDLNDDDLDEADGSVMHEPDLSAMPHLDMPAMHESDLSAMPHLDMPAMHEPDLSAMPDASVASYLDGAVD
ncbi:hypothetical protein [Candidatus Paracaedibacter symbiosus]|uniref:hypothetical protein n=1 Tax=Candidatus Paracaedibacter symbiosus TaxID=244582 RepID=UPI000509C2B2|nr:hypothetical protein [Candidatus Paracaedibacter symbiosus]